jgi:hypothetical protein
MTRWVCRSSVEQSCSKVDACAGAADEIAAREPAGQALVEWIDRYVDFVTKRHGRHRLAHRTQYQRSNAQACRGRCLVGAQRFEKITAPAVQISE